MSAPLRIAFLGCGFITNVHSRQLKAVQPPMVRSYASRDAAKAAEYCRVHGGAGSFADYQKAIESSDIDAVVIAVPPKYHLEIT